MSYTQYSQCLTELMRGAGISTTTHGYKPEQAFADGRKMLNRIIKLEAQLAALTKDAEPLSTNFIQTVPDKCDRIVWRGDYFHLPPKISHINFLTNSMEQEFANYERRGYEKGLAAANTHPPAPDYTDLLKMIAHRARSFPNFPLGHHITEVFAAIGEEPPEPATAPKAITADMVTDEMAIETDLPFKKFIEEKFPNWREIDDTLARKEAIAFAVNAFNGVKP